MPVTIPSNAQVDPQLRNFGILEDRGPQILGVAAGFPLVGVGLASVFRMIDGSALTSGQKTALKMAATAGLGFGGGLAIVSVAGGVREPTVRDITQAAGVGAAAVALGSIALQGFQLARGAGVLPRRAPDGQLVPTPPNELIPLPAFQFR